MKASAYGDLLSFVLDGPRNNSLVAKALETAAPVLKQIQTRESGLWPSSRLDLEEIGRSIALATGRPVRRIKAVSLSALLEQDHRVSDALRAEIHGNSLCDWLIERHASSLWRGLSVIDRYRLFRRLTDLEGSDAAAREGPVWSKLEPGLKSRVWSNLDEGLHFLLCQAMAGNKRQVKKLIPLCRLLPAAIPLGESRNEPGVWFVLTA